jgi:hypothetical protein
MEGTRHGALIAAQMLDVAIRVQAIRHFAVSQMVRGRFHFKKKNEKKGKKSKK